jgi:anti-anti-sigma factor
MLPDLDLRVHVPIPEVVIVRASGTVNRLTASVLAQRVSYQLTRARHVVVDLGDVTVANPRGLAILLPLHHQATARGTQLHIVRAEHDAVRRALHTAGLDQLLVFDSTAEAVIAGLPRQIPPRGGPRRSAGAHPNMDGAPGDDDRSRCPADHYNSPAATSTGRGRTDTT